MGNPIDQWNMQDGTGNAMNMRMGNEGIAFLLFFWAIGMELLHVLVVDADPALLDRQASSWKQQSN